MSFATLQFMRSHIRKECKNYAIRDSYRGEDELGLFFSSAITTSPFSVEI